MDVPNAIKRRTFLGAALASVLTTSCSHAGGSAQQSTTPEYPTMSPDSTWPPTPPECVSLGDGKARPEYLCNPDLFDSAGVEHNRPAAYCFGPLYPTTAGVTAYYINGIFQWDTRTGEITALLAPKRADNWHYALTEQFTVNSRCDGTLMVHTDGCLTAELTGHTQTADAPLHEIVQAIVPVAGGHIASMGADRTIRLWDLRLGTQTALYELQEFPRVRSIDINPTQENLLVSASDGSIALRLDATSLKLLDSYDGLPAVVNGWRQIDQRHLVGLSPDAASPSALIYDLEHRSSTIIECEHTPTALAVSTDGTVAIAAQTRVLLCDAQGQDRTTIELPETSCSALAFSPDGTELYAIFKSSYIASFDLVTGEEKLRFDEPR